jgi:hypothetical protein
MSVVYVLTHEYSDRSGFDVCGATELPIVADTWYKANDENNVYTLDTNISAKRWTEGVKGWKQKERDKSGGIYVQT